MQILGDDFVRHVVVARSQYDQTCRDFAIDLIDLRERHAALLAALEALVIDMRHEDHPLVGWQWIDDRLTDLLRQHRETPRAPEETR